MLSNIFIINMDKDVERMKNISKNMMNYGLQFERISAVNGKQLSHKQIKNYATDTCSNFLCSSSIIGCSLSHQKIWKMLLNDNYADYYIVMEDDAQGNRFKGNRI